MVLMLIQLHWVLFNHLFVLLRGLRIEDVFLLKLQEQLLLECHEDLGHDPYLGTRLYQVQHIQLLLNLIIAALIEEMLPQALLLTPFVDRPEAEGSREVLDYIETFITESASMTDCCDYLVGNDPGDSVLTPIDLLIMVLIKSMHSTLNDQPPQLDLS